MKKKVRLSPCSNEAEGSRSVLGLGGTGALDWDVERNDSDEFDMWMWL
jgi:hypothetical protein